jgi:hypothetical protein
MTEDVHVLPSDSRRACFRESLKSGTDACRYPVVICAL